MVGATGSRALPSGFTSTLCLLALVVQITWADAATFQCKVPSGYALHPHAPCSAYFILCIGGAPFLSHCPQEETFDFEDETCKPISDHVHCNQALGLLDECVGPRRRISVSADDLVFYNCSNGLPVFYVPKMHKIPEKLCAVPDVCDIGKPTPFRCPMEGGRFPHEEYSDLFYICYGLMPQVAHCAPGLLFDDMERSCVSPSKVRFSGQPRLWSQATGPSPANNEDQGAPVSPSNFQCPMSYGHFKDATTEDRYYKCTRWVPKLKRCPQGSVFDNFLGICVLQPLDSETLPK